MDGKHWAKASKRGLIERKRAKIENPYLNAHHVLQTEVLRMVNIGQKHQKGA